MTRINCIPVEELTNKHLIAEYREMLRFRHVYPRNINPSIPLEYVLGKGHVTFFFDKGRYLLKRHSQLIKEMNARGFKTNFNLDLSGWPKDCLNDWEPDDKAMEVNRERIFDRLNKEIKNETIL
jgi:deoxyribonuclease (pyrimidine dimer)